MTTTKKKTASQELKERFVTVKFRLRDKFGISLKEFKKHVYSVDESWKEPENTARLERAWFGRAGSAELLDIITNYELKLLQ